MRFLISLLKTQTDRIKDGIRKGNEYRLRAPLTVVSNQPTPAINENPVQPSQLPENTPLASSSEHSRTGSLGNESAMLPTTWSSSNIEIEMTLLLDDIQSAGQV